MWPNQPSNFESLVSAPESFDKDRTWHFVCIDGQIGALVQGGRIDPIDGDAYRWLDIEVAYEHFLGVFDGRACFAVAARGRLPEGYALGNLRSWLGRVDPEVFYLAGRAVQVVDWHITHQFCGRCGAATVDHPQDRAKQCPECGYIAYPRLSPSIIVLVHRGDKLLLARNAAWPNGMYSTLAGFVEPGESIEQTVHREVFEEVGIRVKNLRYLGSQSWPFPNSLMLGFHAEYDSGEFVLQTDEISDAQWFAPDELPNIPPATAISRWLIDDFLAQVDKT